MVSRKRLIAGFISVLCMIGTVRADMVTVGNLDAERPMSSFTPGVPTQTQAQRTNLSSLHDNSVIVDFHLNTVQFLYEDGAEIGQHPSQTPQFLIDLTGGPGSASLCLYALMGMGLCSAPHWIKKLHVGHIPEWYHDGAPFQIGHSFAVSPETLYPVPVYCFMQPDDTVEELIPQYRQRAVISLWRKSQFTPDVIASRGPPLS
ncbi:hypothetical protein ACFL5Z_04155 [Planctomycetota bacterium]